MVDPPFTQRGSAVRVQSENFADCKRIACPWQGRLEQGDLAGLLDRHFVALAHRLNCDSRERRVHLLTHALLPPADGLQVATGCLQVRVPEPQLDCPDINTRQQVHTSEGVPAMPHAA
jgi:hypothetical protein